MGKDLLAVWPGVRPGMRCGWVGDLEGRAACPLHGVPRSPEVRAWLGCSQQSPPSALELITPENRAGRECCSQAPWPSQWEQGLWLEGRNPSVRASLVSRSLLNTPLCGQGQGYLTQRPGELPFTERLLCASSVLSHSAVSLVIRSGNRGFEGVSDRAGLCSPALCHSLDEDPGPGTRGASPGRWSRVSGTSHPCALPSGRLTAGRAVLSPSPRSRSGVREEVGAFLWPCV